MQDKRYCVEEVQFIKEDVHFRGTIMMISIFYLTQDFEGIFLHERKNFSTFWSWHFQTKQNQTKRKCTLSFYYMQHYKTFFFNIKSFPSKTNGNSGELLQFD